MWGAVRQISCTGDIARAAAVLEAGGIVAFPTETVYGLGADASNPDAVDRVYAVKRRPPGHPLIVHLWDVGQLGEWAAHVPSVAWRLARCFWPGPLTLILQSGQRVARTVTGGCPTVGLRVPAHPMALALLERFGGGVAAPSANRFGGVSPTEAAHVIEELGSEVDVVLDGGRCAVGVESTIVDVSSGDPVILRPGGVTREALEQVLAHPVAVRSGGPVRCPGQFRSHYAPRARVVLASPDEIAHRAAQLADRGLRVGVLAGPGVQRLPAGVVRLNLPTEMLALAQDLYGLLRDVDRRGLDAVVVVLPPDSGLGLAVNDRLWRAAGPRGEHGVVAAGGSSRSAPGGERLSSRST